MAYLIETFDVKSQYELTDLAEDEVIFLRKAVNLVMEHFIESINNADTSGHTRQEILSVWDKGIAKLLNGEF